MLEAIRYSVDNGLGSLLLLEQVGGSGIERLACNHPISYMALRSILFPSLSQPDLQRKLPLESEFIPISGPEECWTAIRDMTVRGAPAIAIAAALSLAVELSKPGVQAQFGSAADATAYIVKQLDYLVTRSAYSAHRE
jgi:hypothetical protein